MAETYTESYGTQGQSSWRNGLDKVKDSVGSLRDNVGNLRGNVNVGKKERWAMVLGGAALAALALRRRSKGSLGLAALGAPLLWRGATGHCPVYQKMGIDRTNGLGNVSLAPIDEGVTTTEFV